MVPSPYPREDDDGGDGESSSASEWDDALDEDMEALRRACEITGRRPADIDGYSGGEGSDSEDDLDLLRSIQERFPLPSTSEGPPILKPLNAIPSMDSEEEDDFETLRAIQRRFVQYENGKPHGCASNLLHCREYFCDFPVKGFTYAYRRKYKRWNGSKFGWFMRN